MWHASNVGSAGGRVLDTPEAKLSRRRLLVVELLAGTRVAREFVLRPGTGRGLMGAPYRHFGASNLRYYDNIGVQS